MVVKAYNDGGGQRPSQCCRRGGHLIRHLFLRRDRLGMVVVFNLMIGLLTPPMGLALFLVADIAKVTMKEVLKEMMPYYVPRPSCLSRTFPA